MKMIKHSEGEKIMESEKIIIGMFDERRFFVILPSGTITTIICTNIKLLNDTLYFCDANYDLIAKIESSIDQIKMINDVRVVSYNGNDYEFLKGINIYMD